MPQWLHFALIAIVLWGIVGLLQKLGTNRVSAASLLVWLTIGFVLFLPWFVWTENLGGLTRSQVSLGVLIGLANGLGSWFLFLSLERGAKASIAVPFTALYPLVTIVFATILLAERLSVRQWIGIAFAITAAAMLSYEAEPGNQTKDHAYGAAANAGQSRDNRRR